MNPKVDFYFSKSRQWQEELSRLRKIILDCGLAETLKWGVPCYTFQHANIVLMHVFKQYCAVLFFKGALLDDANGILTQQTEHVQAARQVRFTNIKEVVDQEAVLRAYVYEAIEIEKAGLKVVLKETAAFKMPEELQIKLTADGALKTAFEKLTPGRQRAYILYFAAPKQTKTRETRIDKSIPQIFAGKGLNDR